jgi:co-chaperonin GroES (HSP10)
MAYDSIDQAFPDADPGFTPFGSKVLVQIRTPMLKSRGGIALPQETRETEQWNTQVAKVIKLGPAAFCNRETLEEWPEGKWVQPGAFVRCPKYGGDRWEVPVPNSLDMALFVVFDDLDLSGEVPEDKVLETVAYLK